MRQHQLRPAQTPQRQRKNILTQMMTATVLRWAAWAMRVWMMRQLSSCLNRDQLQTSQLLQRYCHQSHRHLQSRLSRLLQILSHLLQSLSHLLQSSSHLLQNSHLLGT